MTHSYNENIVDLDKKDMIDKENDEEANEGESELVSGTEVLSLKYLEVDPQSMPLLTYNSGPEEVVITYS